MHYKAYLVLAVALVVIGGAYFYNDLKKTNVSDGGVNEIRLGEQPVGAVNTAVKYVHLLQPGFVVLTTPDTYETNYSLGVSNLLSAGAHSNVIIVHRDPSVDAFRVGQQVTASLYFDDGGVEGELDMNDSRVVGPDGKPLADTITIQKVVPKQEVASVGTSTAYKIAGRTVTVLQNGLSFNLPEGWSATIEGSQALHLLLPQGQKVATIICPAMGEGPYESATTTPTISRTFSHSNFTYEVNFEEWGENRVEFVKTETGLQGRYVGPPTKTDVVKSVVHPVGTPAYERGCILSTQGATVPLDREIIGELKNIYLSWH